LGANGAGALDVGWLGVEPAGRQVELTVGARIGVLTGENQKASDHRVVILGSLDVLACSQKS
jgi:isopenicillin N synthase-like dioxygenase